MKVELEKIRIEQEINRLKAKPTLFSTDMVKAIRENRKTETRRIVKFPNDWDGKTVYNNFPFGCKYGVIDDVGNELLFRHSYKSLFPNNYLWVRETWQHTKILNLHPTDENYGYVYKASEEGNEFQNNIEYWIWKPSIYMPKEACRLILKIESIGVERLQDITGESALREGIEVESMFPLCIGDAYRKFQLIWIKINGKESWNSNPFVWVIKFSKHIQI
jgi:hypothetical protein